MRQPASAVRIRTPPIRPAPSEAPADQVEAPPRAHRATTCSRRRPGPARRDRARAAGGWPTADREAAAVPLADRVEWAVFSLLSTAGPLSRDGVPRADRRLFTGHDLPDEALVRACLQSYRSRASTAGPDRDRRRPPPPRPGAHRADRGCSPTAATASGCRVWIGRREQARRIGRRRPRRPGSTSASARCRSRRPQPRGRRGRGGRLRLVRPRQAGLPVRGRMDRDARRADPPPPRPDPPGRGHRPVPRRSPRSGPSSSATSSSGRRCSARRSTRDNWHVIKWNHLRAFLGPRRARPRRRSSRTSASIRSSSGAASSSAVRGLERRGRRRANSRPRGTLTANTRRSTDDVRPTRPPATETRPVTSPTSPVSPSSSSPTGSGRRSSSSTRPRPRSTATSATPIASRTRARPVAPGPRRLMEETKAAAEAIPPDGLSVEERITRDMLDRDRRPGDRGGRPGHPSPAGRRPDRRPADAPAPDLPVPAGRHARAAREVRRPARGLSRLHGGQHRHPPRGPRDRPDGAADRRRADDRPARAAARDPDRRGDRPGAGPGRDRGRSRARPEGPRGGHLPGRSGVPRGRSGATTSRRPARSPASGRRRTATPSTGPRSGPGRRSSSSPRRSTRSGSTSSRPSTTAGARSRSAPVPRRRRRIASASPTIRRTRRARRRSSSPAPARTSTGRWSSRRATSGRCRRPASR